MSALTLLSLALLALPPTVAGPAERAPPEPTAVAAAAAVFPGLLVHGAGHFVAGDRPAAYRLLAMEGAGVGLTGAGFATLWLTGASRHLSPLIFATPVAGVGMFLVSWLADVQGVAVPADARGAPLVVTPSLEARVGTRYVHDPTIDYGTLVGPGLDLRWRRWRLSPGAWIATSGHNTRLELEAGFRATGPRPDAAGADGSYVEVVLGAVHHRFHEEFDLTVLEVGARGRFDLRRLAPSLAGSFAEWGLGLGWALTHFQVGAHETDADGLLLARFGYGLYFGQAPGRTGEIMAYYDHRHDDYAGGMKLTGLASGAAGHVGLEGSWYFHRRWGVRAEAQVGSAYLAGLSLVHRAPLLETP